MAKRFHNFIWMSRHFKRSIHLIEEVLMQKIVIAEYGVFEPSETAIRAYAARKGITLSEPELMSMTNCCWTVPKAQRSNRGDTVKHEHLFYPEDNIKRDDPDFAAMVVKLKGNATQSTAI